MRPYVILKRPGKAILFLIIMLLLIVKDSYGQNGGYHVKCSSPCFGSAKKVKMFNQNANGYLRVVGNAVMANYQGQDGQLYQIPGGKQGFYLYDASARRFICWRNNSRRPSRGDTISKHTLVGKKFNRFPLPELCAFKDPVAKGVHFSSTHVQLTSRVRGNLNLTMRFNKRGKYMKREREECLRKELQDNWSNMNVRHRRKCDSTSAFLQITDCICPEAEDLFCNSPLKNAQEFRELCRISSNETYET